MPKSSHSAFTGHQKGVQPAHNLTPTLSRILTTWPNHSDEIKMSV